MVETTGKSQRSRAVTIDAVPSNEELRKTIMDLPVQGKAHLLTLSSPGMRIGETVQLTGEDLEWDRDPAKVTIRGEHTKTGSKQLAFIIREANRLESDHLEFKRNVEKRLEKILQKSHYCRCVIPVSRTVALLKSIGKIHPSD